MSGCCRFLPAKICVARYSCSYATLREAQAANNVYMQNMYARQYDHGAHLAAVRAEEQERAAMYGMDP